MKGAKIEKILFYVVILLNFYFFGPYIYRSYVKINKLKLEQKQIELRTKQLREKIDEYDVKINTLEDEFQREKIARNRLQMIKEKEEIYRFINKKQEEK